MAIFEVDGTNYTGNLRNFSLICEICRSEDVELTVELREEDNASVYVWCNSCFEGIKRCYSINTRVKIIKGGIE